MSRTACMLPQAMQYPAKKFVNPRSPTSKGKNNNPPIAVVQFSSSPFLGNNGSTHSSSCFTAPWPQPSSATAAVAFWSIGASIRAKSVLLPHTKLALNTPNNRLNKIPNAKRPRYSFKYGQQKR